jgi:large subunit ribosomal protein L25
MTTNTLEASVRPSHGKGPCRRLRASGQMPAVAYGLGDGATPLAVSPKALGKILSGEHGLNTVVDVQVAGQANFPALVVDYQIHPVTRAFLHVDFKKIDLDKTVDVEVKLELTGKPEGVTAGGELHQVFRKLLVRCRPRQIPVKLVHDVTSLALDTVAHVKDLKLPEGVEVLLPPERTIAGVQMAKKRKDDEEEAAAAAAGATPDAAAGAKTSEAPKAKASEAPKEK